MSKEEKLEAVVDAKEAARHELEQKRQRAFEILDESRLRKELDDWGGE